MKENAKIVPVWGLHDSENCGLICEPDKSYNKDLSDEPSILFTDKTATRILDKGNLPHEIWGADCESEAPFPMTDNMLVWVMIDYFNRDTAMLYRLYQTEDPYKFRAMPQCEAYVCDEEDYESSNEKFINSRYPDVPVIWIA